jgi:hypothetical protein
VLIEVSGDHVCMFGYVVIALLLLAGPLALVWGADSRIDERSRRRSGV